MGKVLLIVGLVVIGVAAGFVVRLLLPGSALGGRSSVTSGTR